MSIDNVRNHQPVEGVGQDNSSVVNTHALTSAVHVEAVAENVLSNAEAMPNFDDDDDVFMSSIQEFESGITNQIDADRKIATSVVEDEKGKMQIETGSEIENQGIEQLLSSKEAMMHVKVMHFEGKSLILKGAHEFHPDALKDKVEKREIAIVKGHELHVHPEAKHKVGSSIKVIDDGVERKLVVKHLSAADLKQLTTVITDFIMLQQNQLKTPENKDAHVEAKHETSTSHKDRPHTVIVLSGQSKSEKGELRPMSGEKKQQKQSATADQVILAQDEAKIKEERRLKKEEIAIDRLLVVILRDIEHHLIANASLALENCKRDHSFAQITHDQIAKHQKMIASKA